MKLNYHVKQVNSPFEDTAFFIRNTFKKRAFMFDCGRIGGLQNSEVLSISDIFISHTHMDHFYGFDRILRGTLLSENRLRIFGPAGIIKNVRGKLDSYTWNLIHSYPVSYEVVELREGEDTAKTALFRAENGFETELSEIAVKDIDLKDNFTFKFAEFEHRVPSMGYRISEPLHIIVDKDKLADTGYKADRWLRELKLSLDAGCRTTVFEIPLKDGGTVERNAEELEKMLISYSPPQVITFLTDLAPTYENFEKAVKLADNSDILLIEAVFLRNDISHALKKRHLTLELAKEIFNISKSKKVRFFHFAPRYDAIRNQYFEKVYEGMKGKIL